jgi:hypothetical protein
MKERIFIGKSLVKEVMDTNRKTPTGNKIFEVEFDNGKKQLVTDYFLKNFTTKSKEDLTKLRQKIVDKMVESFMAMMIDSCLTFNDVQNIVDNIMGKSNSAMDRSISLLWDGNDDNWIPGVPYTAHKSFLEMDFVLTDKKYAKEEDNTI